ncbi:hypothetical protein DDE83_005787 [Stemphylium lycopersici]|uniref:Uncharacterized protein n=1 Tax=Stemphylium lycopersici TaxID=183478 RepID=A0A364N0J9_STELY|nr:hypothetical protein DDE83_005787 [Stemphylium lycopersici]
MHLAIVPAGLAAFAIAVPLDKSISSEAKREIAQPVVEGYGTYGTYYESYGNYPSAEEAKIAAAKREESSDYGKYTTYGCYLAASEADATHKEKRGYSCYTTYGKYPATAGPEANKMDDANMEKRNMMVMPKEMMDMTDDDDGTTDKHDMSTGTEMAGDTKYKSYNPYSSYGTYGSAVDAEAEMQIAILAPRAPQPEPVIACGRDQVLVKARTNGIKVGRIVAAMEEWSVGGGQFRDKVVCRGFLYAWWTREGKRLRHVGGRM